MSKKLFTMKPENILKTDWLDILFENKNKAYGAYDLRKFYNQRLKKAIGFTSFLVLIFAGLQSWKTPQKKVTLDLGPLSDVILDPYKEDKKQEKIEKPKTTTSVKSNVALHTVPIIEKNPDSLHTIKPNEAFDSLAIVSHIDPNDNHSSQGNSGVSNVISGAGQINGDNNSSNNNDDSEIVISNPSVMPEFIGGIDALRNFMLHNLRQPNDIEVGERIVVVVKFVVDKNGNIDNAEIVQNGREDLDEEVLRVVKKMPTWKPGLQNGYPVAAYFKMPITFLNNE